LAGYGSGGPVAWATIDAVPGPGRVWQALSDMAPDNGLVPFLLDSLDVTSRPWDDGEFNDPADLSPLSGIDAGDLLASMWRGEMGYEDEPGLGGDDFDNDYGDDEDEFDEEFAEMIAPFSRQFPGLAPAVDQQLSAQEIQRALDSLRSARIGLAVASRPADVLPSIGWDGACNWTSDALPIAAVLRSWEERFGATLLTIGFAEIQLLAHRPPRTRQAAQLLAAEQFAFCDECAGKGLHDVSSITDHLLRSPIWTFWWD